ncbi:MAG: GAF domain-containing protein, partial [Proteobacteria bacterium]|nr:GAF domain-containing protein [Pseudomonadota bacterium]
MQKGARAADTGEQDALTLSIALQQALPVGSRVSVRWQERPGDTHTCTLAGSDELDAVLGACALQLLSGEATARATPTTDVHAPDAPDRIEHLWQTAAGSQAAIVATLAEAVAPPARVAWLELAKRLVDAHLVAARAQARIESLEKSERLQQALYEIANLAGSDLEMTEMLRRIHGVVASLMYAGNFYIVLYDEADESVRFLYFADRLDPFVAAPEQSIPASEMPNSLTLALLRHGEPVQGRSDDVREQLGVGADQRHGPDAEDWLGVPMRRDDRVCGAIVVQTYDRPGVYCDEERALLVFVAQHILTALDRHQAREELERRVEERTLALQLSNRDLQAEIVERQRGERLQRALFRIAELSITSDTLERFYAQVHDVVGELLYARNFYIA